VAYFSTGYDKDLHFCGLGVIHQFVFVFDFKQFYQDNNLNVVLKDNFMINYPSSCLIMFDFLFCDSSICFGKNSLMLMLQACTATAESNRRQNFIMTRIFPPSGKWIFFSRYWHFS